MVIEVAREMVLQKFSKVPGLKERLMATGSAVIAETTEHDKIWGNGVVMEDVRAK